MAVATKPISRHFRKTKADEKASQWTLAARRGELPSKSRRPRNQTPGRSSGWKHIEYKVRKRPGLHLRRWEVV